MHANQELGLSAVYLNAIRGYPAWKLFALRTYGPCRLHYFVRALNGEIHNISPKKSARSKGVLIFLIDSTSSLICSHFSPYIARIAMTRDLRARVGVHALLPQPGKLILQHFPECGLRPNQHVRWHRRSKTITCYNTAEWNIKLGTRAIGTCSVDRLEERQT